MVNFEDLLKKDYKELEDYIKGSFNKTALHDQKQAIQTQIQTKINEAQVQIENNQTELDKLAVELKGGTYTQHNNRIKTLSAELSNLDDQIQAFATNQGQPFAKKPLNVALAELTQKNAGQLIAELKLNYDAAFKLLDTYFKETFEAFKVIQENIDAKRLGLEDRISEKNTDQKTLEIQIKTLEENLEEFIKTPSSLKTTYSQDPVKILKDKINQSKADARKNQSEIEKLQAETKALTSQLITLNEAIRKQTETLNAGKTDIFSNLAEKEKAIATKTQLVASYNDQKQIKENELVKNKEQVFAEGTDAIKTKEILALVQKENKEIAELKEEQFLADLEQKQSQTLKDILTKTNDEKLVASLKTLQEQRIMLARDRLKIAGFDALKRAGKSYETLTITNTTPGFNKLPTQEELEKALKQLRLDSNSRVTYHEGGSPMGPSAQLKITGSNISNGQKGAAAAALLGWKEHSVESTNKQVLLETVKESLRLGVNHVKINSFENDKDVKILQRIFDIKKIALKPLSDKENFEGKKSEAIRLYDELGNPEYKDKDELQKTLLTILTPRQVGELFASDKITATQVAVLAKEGKVSLRLEYINAVKDPQKKIELINEYLKEFNQSLNRFLNPFIGRKITDQCKSLLNRSTLPELQALENKLELEDKPKLQKLVAKVMEELKASKPRVVVPEQQEPARLPQPH